MWFDSRPVIDISYTQIAYCYEDLFIPFQRIVVHGTHSAATCNHVAEAAVPITRFRACADAGSDDVLGRGLGNIFCRVAGTQVAFTDTQLTCPSWSIFPGLSGAGFAIDADAAFLGFWGCSCPPDHYWGYARDATAPAKLSLEQPFVPLGTFETSMTARVCLPCPEHIVCSPLAVPRPPHRLMGSRYPLLDLAFLAGADADTDAAGGVPRGLLPYAGSEACLHPAACNQEPNAFADGTVADWDSWIRLLSSSARAADVAARAEFRCRQGHDVTSRQCSRCLDGYWRDGFLCRQCEPFYAPLVVISSLGALALLALFVVHRSRKLDSWREHSGLRRTATALEQQRPYHHTSALALWFLQVSGTLQVSAQINGARRTADNASPRTAAALSGGALGSAGLSWLDQLTGFRPWGAECLLGPSWDFMATSTVIMALPWLIATVTAWAAFASTAHGSPTVASRRLVTVSAGLLLLDLLYLPVSARVIEWFNVNRSHDDVRSGLQRAV